MRFSLVLTSLILAIIPVTSQGAITATLNSISSDSLSISLNGTIDQVNALAPDFLLIGVPEDGDWIATFTSDVNVDFTSLGLNTHAVPTTATSTESDTADAIFLDFGTALSVGDSINGDFTFSFMGSTDFLFPASIDFNNGGVVSAGVSSASDFPLLSDSTGVFVPEPSSSLLALVTSFGLMIRRKR